MADLNFLTDAFSGVVPPQVPAGPDLDFLSQSFSQSEPSKAVRLRQELADARQGGTAADIGLGLAGTAERTAGYSADPIGTVLKGLGTASKLSAGLTADVGLETGRLAGLTTQPSNWENLRAAALSTDEFPGPLPIQRQLAQQSGVGPRAAEAILGAAGTLPTLAAGGVLSTAAQAATAPFAVYPALFGAKTLYETGDPHEALKSAAIGAIYPAVGKFVGPLSAGIVNRLGLSNNPGAQRLIETAVDQGLMQATTQVVSLPEYATMTPNERVEAVIANSISVLPFTVPRALGHAAGAPSEYEAIVRDEAARMHDVFRRQEEEAARTAARSETAQALLGVRGATPGRRLASRVADEQGVPYGTTPTVEAPVPVREPAPISGGPAADILPGVPREVHAGTAEVVRPSAETASLAPPLTETGGPNAIPIQGAATLPIREAPGGGQTVGQRVRSPEELAGTRLPTTPEVTAEAAATQAGAAPRPITERLSLKNNVASDLPEVQIAHKDRPGDVIGAWISYNPVAGQRDFLQIRGSSSLSSYRIPLSALPQGSWERTKTGLSVDKAAVLDFLNDPAKRRSAISVTGNAKRFHPEDIVQMQDTKKPVGRPATGAGAPIGEVNVEPRTLEAIAPAVPAGADEMSGITRAAFDRLLQTNPALVESLLKRRPAELDDAFWGGVRSELSKMPEYADDPRKADALVASLKAVKESGSGELEWYQSRGGQAVAVPLTLDSAQGVVRQIVGSLPPNVRLISDPAAPLGFVSFKPGELPEIRLNLSKHASPEALRDTFLEELIHPLQSDPTLRSVLSQIETRITEADLARQRAAGYRPDELLTEATNELLRTLYAQHAEANVFSRAVNQVVLAIKRAFGLQLNDQQVALFLVNRALKNRRAAGAGQAAAFESTQKIEEYTGPLTHEPEYYHAMASVLNRGLVPPPVIARFEALSAGARGELAKVFPGRIGTYRNAQGVVAAGPSFRDVMRDPARTPEQKSDYARNGLAELAIYQKDRQDVHDRLAKAKTDIDEAVNKAITATPPTNEAELLATNLLGGILDKIKAEREKTAEGAQVNERVREGIDNIDRLNTLLLQPGALERAMTGIANQAGRDALMSARPGEEALDLISTATGFEGGVFGTPREWISALATHLDQLMRSDGTKAILAGRDVIESALYGLRQLGDARQALLEVQMTADGTLRQFNADYMADLRLKVPRGFNTVLNKYAKAKVEADALTAAFRRLNRRIDTLTERRANLEEAVTFLNEHDRNPDFADFGRAVVQYTGAADLQFTTAGPVVTYVHPLTGELVPIEHTFEKGDTVETIHKLQDLAQAGLQYAAQPNADPQKAAYWRDFANVIDDYLLVASPDYKRLQDPLINPLAIITKAQFGIIAESTLSRIPGVLQQETTRALQAWATAVKAKNEFQKDNEARILGDNTTAMRTHEGMTLDRWQREVASPIHDSKQHYGQTPYKAGDRIVGFGHLITKEDMKAVDSQYRYEQTLRKLHERVKLPVLTEAPAKIKEGASLQRFALSHGPGTVTRYLPRTSQNLPKEWNRAVAAPVEEGAVDRFLNTGDNFVRVMLGNVNEEERDYVLLGKEKFGRDYKALRLQKQALQASGEMPNNLNSLSDWLANHHNEHLSEGEAPITSGDVRKALIEEVTKYMGEIEKHTAETQASANAAAMNIVVYENGFTRPRGGKIAPGTLYEYGLPDRAAMIAKGNDAVEFYTIRYRDALQALHNGLLDNRQKLKNAMEKRYGSEGIGARRKLDAGIRGGEDAQLQRLQLTWEETSRNINRTTRLLNNFNDILNGRQRLYGDDIANRTFSPFMGSLVGSVLMRPLTWLRNGSSGTVMWGMLTGEIRKGGWLYAPPAVLKAHIVSFIKTLRLRFTPKNAKEAAYKRVLDNPEITNGIAREASLIMQEALHREELRRAGVIDSFSTREYLGLDSERTALQNVKAAMDVLRNISARTETSLTKEVFSYLGMAPRAYQIITRKVGMRWADNWINVQSTQFANSLAEVLRHRAIQSFDARMENDPVFKQLYDEYGDNFKRFSIALAGRGEGGLLTPAELTGKWDPRTTDKAAIQLRRLFSGNNDSVDKIMLKYWWNQRNAGGDRNAPFMTDGQGLALMFAMAANVNMGTLANRAQFFAGNKFKQLIGVLGQYWLWNTDRLVDLVSKPHGQRTLGMRYLPGALGFLLVSAIAGVISTHVGQEANDLAFNTVSQKPDWWDATDDATRLKIIASSAGGYWGAIGSLVAKLVDQPGKLGYTNPIFFFNVATDLMNMGTKMWQSHDMTGPTLDFLAKYLPPFQAVINRLPGREGLLEVRNAANALRAATPSSLESKRRQPSAGSDFSLTPMTPLYNGIVNAAAQGNWSQVDELMSKAVEQQRALGNANPENAILSAIRTRSPEAAVYQRVLTPEERDMVYSRLSPENRALVEKENAVFDELSSRYGHAGGGGGAVGSGSLGRTGTGGSFGQLPRIGGGGPGGGVGLSLGAPGGVRRGFRTRSLLRGGRLRGLRGGRTGRLRLRFPRLTR